MQDNDDDILQPPPAGYKWGVDISHEQVNQYYPIQRRLALNDFPYFVAPGIQHWCLWKLGGGGQNDKDCTTRSSNVTEQDIQEAIQLLRDWGATKKMKLVDVLHFVNPPHLKSVKEIDHAHIMCLWGTVEQNEDEEQEGKTEVDTKEDFNM